MPVKNALRNLVRWSSRLAGSLLLQTNMATLSLRSRATQEKIEDWMDNIDLFFILAIGRSGSMFLANLLNQAPGAKVYHEPTRVDFAAYIEAFHEEKAADDYLRRFRKLEIYHRVHDGELKTYGEVNSNLRRHGRALKEAFRSVTLIHLVRDGRDAIRSMMSRRTFRPWDPVTAPIEPREGEPWAKEWPRMDRFERLSWYWMSENRYLRRVIDRTVQIEKLLSDYEYFATRLLDPLGLTVSEHAWQVARQRPKNATKQYQIPHWSDWETQRREAFESICGEEMYKNGYEIDWR